MTSDGRSEGHGRSFEETLSDQSKGSEAVAVQRADSAQMTPSDPQMSEIQTLEVALPADVTQVSEAGNALPGRGILSQSSAADVTVNTPGTRSRPTLIEGPLLSDPATHVRPTIPHIDGSRSPSPMAEFPMLQVANTTGDNRVNISALTDVSTVKLPHSPSLPVLASTEPLPQALTVASMSLSDAVADGDTKVPTPAINLTIADAPALPTRPATPTTAQAAADMDLPAPKAEANTAFTTVKMPQGPSLSAPTETDSLPQTLTVATSSLTSATVDGGAIEAGPATHVIKADVPALPTRQSTTIETIAPGPKAGAHIDITAADLSYRPGHLFAASTDLPPQTLTAANAAIVADVPTPKTGPTSDISTVKLPQSPSLPVTASSEPLPQTLTVATSSPSPSPSLTGEVDTLALAPDTKATKANTPALPTPPPTPTTAQAAADTDSPASKVEVKADTTDRPTLSTRAADTADYRALAQSSSHPTESVKMADGPMQSTPLLGNSDTPVLPKSLPVMTALPTLTPLSGMSDRLAATIMQTTQAQPTVTLDKLPQTVVAIALTAKTATLQIDPPELGRIQLDYQFDSQGRTVVTLTPESDAARAALMDRMASIIAALEQGSDKPVDVQLGDARDFGSEFDQTPQDDRGSGSNTKDGVKTVASDNAPSHDQQRFMRAQLGEAERLHILV